MSTPLPVICDHCRREGTAGDPAFKDAGDLLAFTPVPRKVQRVDGWTPDRQRAFIATLALVGSPRRAARAIGMREFGALQLRAAEGSEGFAAAWDAAMEMAADRATRKLDRDVEGTIAREKRREQADGRPAHFPRGGIYFPPRNRTYAAMAPKQRERADRELFQQILNKYIRVLRRERRAREEGRIAEADYTLRQVTVLEILMSGLSDDAFKAMQEFRIDGVDVHQIAETPLSRLLDDIRREHWDKCGDPPRPDPPHYPELFDEREPNALRRPNCTLLPSETCRGGHPMSDTEQRLWYRQRYEEDARKQVEWEAQARRDHERRRTTPPRMDEEPGVAGQPAPERRQD